MSTNKMLGKKAIAVWVAIAAIVGTGSFAIATSGGAVHQEDAPDIQHSSDVKIHLQDVDGKVITNVPIMANRAFSPLPVEFRADDEPALTTATNGAVLGSTIQTKQKVVANLVADVSTAVEITFDVDNNSEDPQIFLIKANAPSHVMLDLENGTDVTIHGLTGHNEWLASIGATSTTGQFEMEVSVTDAGFYPIVVELLRIG